MNITLRITSILTIIFGFIVILLQLPNIFSGSNEVQSILDFLTSQLPSGILIFSGISSFMTIIKVIVISIGLAVGISVLVMVFLLGLYNVLALDKLKKNLNSTKVYLRMNVVNILITFFMFLIANNYRIYHKILLIHLQNRLICIGFCIDAAKSYIYA